MPGILLVLAMVSGCGGSDEGGVPADRPIQSAVPAKRFPNCDSAKRREYVHFRRAIVQASQGNLAGVETATVERAELVLANRTCFSAAHVATAKKVRYKPDDLPEAAKNAPKRCRDTVADVAELLNFAGGLKAVSKEDSDEAAEGFRHISARDRSCFGEDDVRTVLGTLAKYQP